MNVIPCVETNANLYFGYISGDHYWGSEDKIHDMIKTTTALIRKKVNIITPLKYLPKKDIVSFLDDEKLLEYIWTCEMSKVLHEPCGRCIPCQHLAEAKLINKFNLLSSIDQEEIIKLIDDKNLPIIMTDKL